MTKNGLAATAALFASLLPSAAYAQAQYVAQGDSPQWLKDRHYNEGAGIREGDFELHPGIAGEVGYDSNWFLRSSSNNGFVNSGPSTPPIPALVFRVTPSLYLSTLGPQRREGDVSAEPPGIRFRAGVNATYREFIGVSSDAVASQPQNDVSKQRNIGGSADARLEIAPERPFGAALFASFARTILPNAGTADPNLSFNRDDVGVGGEFVAQPGSGTLDWHFGYQFHDTLFEQSTGVPYDNTSNQLYTRGRWRFRPRTSLIYDATFGYFNYANQGGRPERRPGQLDADPDADRPERPGHRSVFRGRARWLGRELLRVHREQPAAVRQRHRPGRAQVVPLRQPGRRAGD